jgi:hypothetical protein
MICPAPASLAQSFMEELFVVGSVRALASTTSVAVLIASQGQLRYGIIHRWAPWSMSLNQPLQRFFCFNLGCRGCALGNTSLLA